MPQTQYTILYFNCLLYKHLESSLIRTPYFMTKYHTLDIFLAQFIFLISYWYHFHSSLRKFQQMLQTKPANELICTFQVY